MKWHGGKKPQTKNKTKKARTSYTTKTEYLTRGFRYTFWWHLTISYPAANAILNTEPNWYHPTTDYNKWDQSWGMTVIKKQTSMYSPNVPARYLQDQLSTYDHIWNRYITFYSIHCDLQYLPDFVNYLTMLHDTDKYSLCLSRSGTVASLTLALWPEIKKWPGQKTVGFRHKI